MSAERDDLEDTLDNRVDDATIVVNDATVAVNDATVAVNDATIAVNDATVAVNDATVAVNDETIVVNLQQGTAACAQPDETGERAVDDATIVVVDSSNAPSDAVSASQSLSTSASNSVSASLSSSISSSVGLPVEDPVDERSLPESLQKGSGLDPDRRIDPMPGMLPWELLPSGEPGVSQDLPVAYGARSTTVTELQLGADYVQREIGPAPVGQPVQVRPGRESLPSLRRHDARRKLITVAGYAGAVVVCVAGLIWVARLAFG